MHFIDWIRGHYIFIRFPFVKQFVKFSFVGTFVTTIDFVTYFLLTRLNSWFAEHFLMANGIAFGLAVTFSFFANKLWTFRNAHTAYRRQYIFFVCSSLIGLAANQAVLYLLVTEISISDVIAKPLAVLVVVIWNFSAYKFFIFKHTSLQRY